METEHEFLAFIQNSSLSQEDKKLWKVFAEQSSQKDLQTILDIFINDEKAITFLTKNLKDKIVAFLAKDKEKMNKILQEEEEEQYLKER